MEAWRRLAGVGIESTCFSSNSKGLLAASGAATKSGIHHGGMEALGRIRHRIGTHKFDFEELVCHVVGRLTIKAINALASS
jgi:hypothetical protein